ncbi:MAG: electron transfer flavoprotein subunit alpha/FixB family protein [Gemmatimonadales bacterium]|nr:MAG: electron transfer flavoprotein subunit alpha/FixB family protein [Gemmatimonadales bacterium]
MSKVLAVVEQREGALRSTAREVVSTAARIAGELGGSAEALLVGGEGAGQLAGELARWGAEAVHVVEHDALAGYHPDGYVDVTHQVIRDGGFEAVLFAASSQGKDLAPRVAARLDVPLAADATGLEVEGGSLRILRPVYAGKAFSRVTVDASPVVVSIRPNVFPAQEKSAAGEVRTVEVDTDPSAWPTTIVSFEQTGGDIPDVAEASVVVSGGRGMKDPENWGLLEELRAALGDEAGLGASRAVVDAGWRPHGEQVGQTGKTVAPKLYFAVGISGAIQHRAGMRTAGTIVAVNRDPEAPIFKVADYGIVGDLFEVLPRLTEEVRTLRQES